jgi:hypothetical protein
MKICGIIFSKKTCLKKRSVYYSQPMNHLSLTWRIYIYTVYSYKLIITSVIWILYYIYELKYGDVLNRLAVSLRWSELDIS